MVGEDPKGPDRLRGWQIGGGLRRSIGAIPLRPDTLDNVLAELKPRVEEELRSLAPVEGSRTLSDREHRQASALRDLLALAQEHRGGEPARPPSEVEEEGARIIRTMKENIFHLEEVLDSLAENAAKDHLTGVYNRKGGEERLAEDVARASRGGESLTLAVLDLDQLKEVNERWGHQAGDAYLRHLINALESNIREGDWIARWGGDEFVVGFWNAKEPSTAEATLQRVAEYLERNPAPLPRGQQGWVSFSAGTCIHRDGESAAELFLRADMALFEAKRKGRNRVITHA